MIWLAVCLFAGLGAMARFVLDTSIERRWNQPFPVATFLINLLAAFFIGLAASAYLNETVDLNTYMIFALGFCGGFATFSTTMGQIVSMAGHRSVRGGAIYAIATVVGSLLCLVFGWWLASLGH